MLASVPAPARRARPASRAMPQLEPMFNVILLDDDQHTYEYVVEMLCTLFGHAFETSYLMACEVDRSGRVIVFTSDRKEAADRRDAIQTFGADPLLPGSSGSMGAEIEPVTG
jgi:ATP-dependent Clp protease adaptor protein ClpS